MPIAGCGFMRYLARRLLVCRVAMMLTLLKVVAVLFGAWLGYLASFAIGYYAGDRGDVSSAFLTMILVPIMILICSVAAYFIASFALGYLQ